MAPGSSSRLSVVPRVWRVAATSLYAVSRFPLIGMGAIVFTLNFLVFNSPHPYRLVSQDFCQMGRLDCLPDLQWHQVVLLEELRIQSNSPTERRSIDHTPRTSTCPLLCQGCCLPNSRERSSQGISRNLGDSLRFLFASVDVGPRMAGPRLYAPFCGLRP